MVVAAEAKFTLRQLISIAGALSALSGAGGAATVMAQDAVQDQKIETNTREIAELRRQVSTIAEATTKTSSTVEGLDEDVDEIKEDTKAIQRLLMEMAREQRSGRR